MDFALPTSKAEMYNTLSEIFHYYRITKNEFKAPQLTELVIPKMTCEELSGEELLQRAKDYVSADHEREIFKRKVELTAKIKALEIEKESIENSAEKNIEKAQELFEQSQLKLNKKAMANGLINSSVYLDKVAELESDMNNKILSIGQDLSTAISKIEAEITYCQQQYDTVEEYFSSVHEKDVLVKSLEIKEKQAQTAREVLKYNNSLEERRHKVKNDIKKTNANLEIKYLEIKIADLSKDQLVKMGYYEDVVRCVQGYYDTLTPSQAYLELGGDETCMLYLEHLFQNLVYSYGLRAGMFG